MVKLKWLGHAAWLIEFKNAKVVIDPFLNGNPAAAMKPEDLTGIDYVMVTHNHQDHVGDSFNIAKQNNSKFVAMYDTAVIAQQSGVSNIIGMNKGSMRNLGNIDVALTNAIHSGNESGIILRADNITIYHAGDTALFKDMELVNKLYAPDIALLPIGGFFTMGPNEAVEAVKMISPKVTIPMHYNTFEQIAQDPSKFLEMCKGITNVVILNPGEEYIHE
ncbi:MAG: metal-dependent hydrolase [Candidatus Marsarchaeota archaeon]|nr:metal-dependent hydrolase [Candidatus Marsarchaeota archaeon]